VSRIPPTSPAYEVAIERVEHLRVPPQRIAERRPLLDVRFDVLQDDLEVLVVGLVREDVEALHDGQAGVDHGGEEAREGDQILLADAGAELEALTLGLLLDLRRVQLLLAEARLDRVLGLGLHRALPELSGLTAGFPCELGHRQRLAGPSRDLVWSRAKPESVVYRPRAIRVKEPGRFVGDGKPGTCLVRQRACPLRLSPP
jgi:hypothetical protein